MIHGYQVPNATFAIAGIACILAAAPARAAAVLAASAIAGAMRTDDLAEMGDAWARMRVTALALLLAAVVLALSATGALAYGVSTRSGLGIALGEALLIISIGSMRVFLAMALGPLRRRRAFEPDRVREAPRGSLGWPYWLVVGGAIFLVASFVRGWLDFLDGGKHPASDPGAYVLWIAVVVIGIAAASFAYVRNKDGALKASGMVGARLSRLAWAGSRNLDRFIVAPVTELARRTGDRWLPEGDVRVASALDTTGRLIAASTRLPVLPVVILTAVILTLVVGLLSPGVFR